MQSFSDKEDLCPRPPMSRPSYLSQPVARDVCTKYYQEIGAEMLSNQLIIRLEKDKSKSRRKRNKWDPPCDCVVIQRPAGKRGPKILNANCDDRIVFRAQSVSHMHKREDPAYKAQTIGYKIGSCKDGEDHQRCKTITVYPQFISGTQEVYSDCVTEGEQNIFLLRIKKKAEGTERKDRNVELELRTPKPPPRPPSPPPPVPAVAPPPREPVPAVAPPQPVADLVTAEDEEPTKKEKTITKKAVPLKAKKKKKKK